MMTSDVWTDADLVFDVIYEKPSADGKWVQCVELGSAEFNFHQLYEYGADLVHHYLTVKDLYDNDIGTLYITIIAYEALKDILTREPPALHM
jgi:hypothetical protein